MTNNPKIRIHFIPTPRYMLQGNSGYRARRPVVVALCVAVAMAMMLGSTLALLWWLNC